MMKTKQVVSIGMAVMTTLLALVVAWQFREVVVYVLISLALASAMRPLGARLEGKKLPVRLAWIALYLAALGGLGYMVFATAGGALSEIRLLAESVAEQDAWILPLWLEGSAFQHAVVAQLPPPSVLFEAVTGSEGQLVLPTLLGLSQGLGSLVSGTVVILLLSIYWGIGQGHFERLWLSLLPSDERKQARDIWRTVEPDLGAYIRSQLLTSLLAGLLLGPGYWLIGSPYPALLALVGALFCLIPVVGAPLAVLTPLLVGLLTSVPLALFTALYALVVVVALGLWVRPWLFNRHWRNPVLTLVLLIALADAFGLVGMVAAPALSVVCQILWSRLVSHPLATGSGAQVSDLIQRQERVWATIRALEEPPPPLVISSMERLGQLIARAQPLLPALSTEPAVLAEPAEPTASVAEPTASVAEPTASATEPGQEP
jgi:predicted PurR-regulated permease PerM